MCRQSPRPQRRGDEDDREDNDDNNCKDDEGVTQNIAVRKLNYDVRRGRRHRRVEDGAKIGVQRRRRLAVATITTATMIGQ